MVDKNKIKRSLLRRLWSLRIIGSHHIRIQTLLRCGIKKDLRGEAKKIIEELIKENWIVYHSKSKMAIKINLDYVTEILGFIEEENE